MPIDPLLLDDLTWPDLMEAARLRIPAASRGAWSLHAPVDPGITILEMYAALIEQRAFRLDQPDPSRIRAVLRLLGNEPRPARAAGVVLKFSGLRGAYDRWDRIEAGTVLQPTPRDAPPAFAVAHALTVLPRLNGGRSVSRLVVGGRDRTDDLRARKAPRLLADDPAVASSIRIAVAAADCGPLPPVEAGFLIDLGASARFPAEWASDDDPLRDAPADASLEWSARWIAGGASEAEPAQLVRDGTSALRRSGVVVLRLPRPPAEAVDRALALELTLRLLGANGQPAAPLAPPRLRRIVVNAALAWNRVPYAASDSPSATVVDGLSIQVRAVRARFHPGLVLRLPDGAAPLVPGSSTLRILESLPGPGGELTPTVREWSETDDLLRHGPDDLRYVVHAAEATIELGDGRHGAIPRLAEPAPARADGRRAGAAAPVGPPQFEFRALRGGGSGGNLPIGQEWEPPGGMPTDPCGELAPRRIVNVTSARGGIDAEEPSAAAARAAASPAARGSRAVTLEDHERVATAVRGAGIKRACAVAGRHPAFPGVNVPGAVSVLIVPGVPRPAEGVDDPEDALFPPPPRPEPPTLRRVQQALDAARLLGSEAFAAPPRYRPIDVRMTIASAARGDDRAALGRRVIRAVVRWLDPLVGGAGGRGWPFGQAVLRSGLLKRVEASLRGEGEVVALKVWSGPEPATDCDDVALRACELPAIRPFEPRFTMPAGRGRSW